MIQIVVQLLVMLCDVSMPINAFYISYCCCFFFLGSAFSKLKQDSTTTLASVSATLEQLRLVVEKMRQQSDCREWHRFRTGRITVSRMKAVCKTSVDKQAKSLIKAICYPETVRFKTSAAQWGCDHEQEGLISYEREMQRTHDSFKMERYGFFYQQCISIYWSIPRLCSRMQLLW